MDNKLFDELMEGMEETRKIITGEQEPSRTFYFEPVEVKAIRTKTGKTQKAFAQWINIPLNTLQNWEQGKRHPTGPAKVLLALIDKNHTVIEKLINK